MVLTTDGWFQSFFQKHGLNRRISPLLGLGVLIILVIISGCEKYFRTYALQFVVAQFIARSTGDRPTTNQRIGCSCLIYQAPAVGRCGDESPNYKLSVAKSR